MPSPKAWASALADTNDTPSPEQRRRKAQSLAQALMQQAGDTSAPVYGKGHGMAKLAAGFVGGLVDGMDARREQERLDAAMKAGNDAAAGLFPGGVPGMAGSPAPAPAGNVSGAKPASFDPKSVPSFVAMAGQPFGVSPDYLTKTAWIESRGNPSARNPSGASGIFQFMPGTARQYGLTDPFDPQASATAAARLAADNRASLQRSLGRDPSDAELYLAHQQGAGGAAKLLANPNARAADVVGAKAVTQNGGRADMTAGEFAGLWTGKYNALSPRQAMTMPAASGGQQTAQADMPAAGAQPVEFNGGQSGFLIPGTDAVVPPPADPGKMAALAQITGGAPPAASPPIAGEIPMSADVPAAPAPMPSPTVGDALRRAAMTVGQDNGSDPMTSAASFDPSMQAVPSPDQTAGGLPTSSFSAPVLSPSAAATPPLPPMRPDGLGAVPADTSTSYDPAKVRMDMTVVPGQIPYDERTVMASGAPAPLPPARPTDLVSPADLPAPGAREMMLTGQAVPPGFGPARLPGAPMLVSNPAGGDPFHSTDAGAGDFARSGMTNGQRLGALLAGSQPAQGGASGGSNPKALAAVLMNGSSQPAPVQDPRALAAAIDPQGAAARAQAASFGAPSALAPNAMGGPAPGPNGPVTAQAGGLGGMPISMAQINALGNSPSPFHQMLAKGLAQRLTAGRETTVVGGALVDSQTGQVVYQAPQQSYTLNPGDTRFGPDNRQVAQGQPKDDRTGNQRDYEAVRAGGFGGSFNEFLQQRSQRQGQAVTIKDVNGSERTMFYDPVSNTLKTPEQMGAPAASGPANPYAPAGKMTEEQGKATGFANRMVEGHSIINDLESVGTGTIEAGLAKLPGSNFLLSTGKQKLIQAQSDFVTALLRRESGAVIGKDEFDRYAKQYFPQPGNPPEVIEQKRRARETAIEGVMASAGPSYQPPVSYQRSPPAGSTSQGQPQASPGKIGPPPGSAGTAPPPTVQPSPQAMEALRTHPGLAEEFDRKYGPGTSARILGGR